MNEPNLILFKKSYIRFYHSYKMLQVDSSNTFFHTAVSFVNQTNRHLFLTGKAGTGKTTFLKYISEHSYKKMAIVAPTGVAAINAGGVTIHSFFQLPLGTFLPANNSSFHDFEGRIYNEHTLLKNQRMNNTKRDVLNELELLVIDEISMVRADTLDAIDLILKVRRKKPALPFGGVQVIYIGDLFQLPSVVKDDEWSLIKNYYKSPFFFDSIALRNHPPVYLELKKIYRQNDDAFISLLNNVRNDCCTSSDFAMLHKYYDPSFLPGKEENYITLTTHNYKADEINKTELDKLPAKLWTFKSEIRGEFNEKSFPAEELLSLKEGAQIMFIKNDSGEARRFYNGKIATVKTITNDSIFISFEDDDDLLELEKETWENIRYNYNKEKNSIDTEEIGTFCQYPIRLAWAITIHKSQGLTFEKAIIDAGASFAAGQAYVALSRLTSLHGLVLQSHITPASISTDTRAIKFLQKEIPEEALQTLLEIEQKNFIITALLKCFNYDAIADTFRQNEENYDHRQLEDKKSCIEWNSKLISACDEINIIAKKFQQQLLYLLQSVNEEIYSKVFDRVLSAEKYFADAIHARLIRPIEDHLLEIKSQRRVKKYLVEVEEIKLLCIRQKDLLAKALQITNAMRENTSLANLLELTKQEQRSSGANIAKAAILKKVKAVKGDTQKITLQMFRDGKTIEEIVNERGLAQTTVGGHLASFISTGEIRIHELIDIEKAQKLITILEKIEGDKTLSEIKAIAGDEYSYLDLRAVMNYREVRK